MRSGVAAGNRANSGTRSFSKPAVIATGGRPVRPAGMPFDDPDVHDSDGITRIDRIPRTLLVVGAGPVGCEIASIFATLGVTVTLIDTQRQILSAFDREVAMALAE